MNERVEDGVWTVEPEASLQSVLDDPACPGLLRRALTGVHSWQVRNETHVERTLRASQLMPQWIAALLALGATITLDGGDDEEEVALVKLVRRETTGDITALHMPLPGSAMRWGEAHVARTPSDDPIVAAFAVVETEDGAVAAARIALTGVWSEPVRLAEAANGLVGEALSEEAIREVAAAVEKGVEPVEDYLGSEAYRRAMAGVLTRRALEACLEQEGADE